MKRIKPLILVGIIAALGAGIVLVGLTWTYVTPVVQRAEPDTASTSRR